MEVEQETRVLQIEGDSDLRREFGEDTKCLDIGRDSDLMREFKEDMNTFWNEVEAEEALATCKPNLRNTIRVADVGEEEKKKKKKKKKKKNDPGVVVGDAPVRKRRKMSLAEKWANRWPKEATMEQKLRYREFLSSMYGKGYYLKEAKEKLAGGDVAGARRMLLIAYTQIPESEEIWLAAFDLEFKDPVRDPVRAAEILALARLKGWSTSRIWMKSAVVARELGDTEAELDFLKRGLEHDSTFLKMWLMLGQLWERLGQLERAKGVYESGVMHCHAKDNCNAPLWLSLSNLEERTNGLAKAREVLRLSLYENYRNPNLWLANILVESRLGYKKAAVYIMNEALQQCPKSGILWAASVELVPQPRRKKKAMYAFRKCKNDPHVFAAIAKVFWHDRVLDQARTWLNNAVTISPDIGDFWALYYKFELEFGTDQNQLNVLNRCVAAEPKHGEVWQVVSKAVENYHLPTQAILKKVVFAL